MLFFSKSKYCALWRCPKLAWLNKYKPGEAVTDDGVVARMEAGNEAGDLAMGLFGDYAEISAYRDGKLDLTQMISDTSAEMAKGTPVICEASFDWNGLYCAVDILKKEKGGWAIYEVKSSTGIEDKGIYIADVAYQKYVLECCGVHFTGVYLVCINSDYVLDGELDLQKLFFITDVFAAAAAEEQNILPNLEAAERLLNSFEEPQTDISKRCKDPYECAFWQYCTRHIPEKSVFNLYRMQFDKKLDYYRKGLVSYDALTAESCITNEKQLRQMDYALNDRETHIDAASIREFLDTMSYPLYFLDFETIQPVIPKYNGTKPYAQIPFQYSLHCIEREGGELLHKEFLAESGADPRRALALRLCGDIPAGACVIAYNKKFECGRLTELAACFPDLSAHLISIRDNIVDLLVPFQSGWYYNRAMGGSFSIKSVLPAVFPDDPSLDYHSLEGVHNGGEAMSIYPRLLDMPSDEREKARCDLLKYCELDTYAMVRLWQELVRVSGQRFMQT